MVTNFIAKKTTSKTCSDACAKKLYKARQTQAKMEANNIETGVSKSRIIEDLRQKEFLTVPEAAMLLKFSARTVYRLIEKGEIKSNNMSKRLTRIRRADIENLFSV